MRDTKSFWWDRARRADSEAPTLEAVIFSLDEVLSEAHDGPLLRECVWGLYCAGIRVAVVTAHHGLRLHRTVRDLLGDGAVEVMVTGDEVAQPKPHPEVYRRALHDLGIRPAAAMAVEDSADGLRAARGAGLATVVVTTERTSNQDFTGAAAVLPGYGGYGVWIGRRTSLSA